VRDDEDTAGRLERQHAGQLAARKEESDTAVAPAPGKASG
jgi:hypothetical protein